MYNIKSISLRSAKVTNLDTNITRVCKVEPYHRKGCAIAKAYVVMHDDLNSPILRHNINNYTGPVDLVNVDLNNRGRNSSADWSSWGQSADTVTNDDFDFELDIDKLD